MTPITKIRVSDPFGAAADPELPALAAALDPAKVKEKFKRGFRRLTTTGFVVPKSIRVTRYKPGRRAVVEYDVRIEEGREKRGKLILLGKVRARRSGNEGFRQLDAIWRAGFAADSTDEVSVPEPVGVIPHFRMWFQRKVPGQTATELLAGPGATALARRVAEAIHKLHCANVPTERRHTMADELRILRDCLGKVALQQPAWAKRTQRVWEACARLGASVPAPNACGVHRDFYPAQVIVDGARLWLIDFDLYCLGDPGLDAGNFIGHVTEQALREHGTADALAEVEHALEERFVELAGEGCRASVRAYTVLTLARHIYLSTQFAERATLTPAIIDLCEDRLGLARAAS